LVIWLDAVYCQRQSFVEKLTMKNLLQQWFNQLINGETGPAEEREFDLSNHIDLLNPISQLYGVEFHPSVYRYYER
jgi:hypothetical protein